MSTLAQRSFSGGEIAPALYARVDIQKYATGLRTCRNFFVMRHGGASNRSGTQFIGEVKDSTKTVKLIPFVFNTSQTYVLEFGDQYMRVIRNGAHVTETAKTITGITQANPAVVTSASHGYTSGDEIYVSGIVGMTQLNGRNLKVTVLNANTYSLQYLDGTNVNSTAFTAYSSGGSTERLYKISTPYVEDDLLNLQYVQSADVVTIVHPQYAPRELARTGHTSWTLSTITFAPETPAPTSPSASQNGATGSVTYKWKITSIDSETGEESLPTAEFQITNGNATLSSTNYVAISWTLASGIDTYNIYREKNGIFGYVGTAEGTSFRDIGLDPDTADAPPSARNPFDGVDNYPATVTYFQQRLMFANTDNDPERIQGSRIGAFKNFTTSSPIQDDDAVNFTMAGRQVNSVNYLIDLGKLIVFTAAGEWAVEGDSSGILRPGEVNPKQYSYNGSATGLPPIIIGNTALYVQARGSVVRDLGFSFESDGYTGNDLTIYSAHMFDNYSLIDWAYQQIPHSVLWIIRDDGTLLGLTYVREQQLLAWHRHDFDGIAENVCVIPEGNEDVLYLVIRREIDGVEKRYIERLSTRQVNDVKDCTILDCFLSYDGRNTTAGKTMTLSGGTTWLYTETLTLTCSASQFTASDVGNQIHLYDEDTGEVIRFEIRGYTSATVVTGKAHKTVPEAMRGVATETWTRAVDQISGLWHLEGKDVSVFADGFVVANPNNAAYDVRTIEDGVLTLDKPYGVIHVGLPITADLETLNIDTPQGESIVDKNKLVNKVTIFVEDSRGAWIGGAPPDETVGFLDGLTETKLRNTESYDDPVALTTGVMEVNIQAEWNSNGRVFIRQTDPIPLSVLAVAPSGMFPFRG